MAWKYSTEMKIILFLLIAYHFTWIANGVPSVCYCHKSGTGLTKCRKWTITPQSCYGNCVYTVDVAIESATVTIKSTTIAWRKHVDWPFTSATLQVEKTWPMNGRITDQKGVYYIDVSVLLENTPHVKFLWIYIEDLRGIFSISSLVKAFSHFFTVDYAYVYSTYAWQMIDSCLLFKQKLHNG